MYKKAWCTCKVVVLRNKTIAFLTSWLPSPSSLLKLSNAFSRSTSLLEYTVACLQFFAKFFAIALLLAWHFSSVFFPNPPFLFNSGQGKYWLVLSLSIWRCLVGAAHGSTDQLHQLDRHQRLNSSIGDEFDIMLPFPRRSWLWGKKGDRPRSILLCLFQPQYWPSLISFSVSVLSVIPILAFVDFLFSVGVIGYPNVGKSSIINTLRAKKVCNVAPIAGETKAS